MAHSRTWGSRATPVAQFDSLVGDRPHSTRMRTAPAFTLTHELLAEHGGAVVCIDERGIGKRYQLYRHRPDASLNHPIFRADIISPDGSTNETSDLVEQEPALIRVDIRGPIEQRAGCHGECGAWSDGHDAIAERTIEAMRTSDVLMVFDTPGGAHAGIQAAIDNVVREKDVYGRRVTGYVDEMCGSAGYWWAACVCDEIYGPASALVGSIGARAGHQSVAGALAQAGVETTFFAWPGRGKVAFAPELPLSEEGAARGNRDVAFAGESFAAAVGPRRGLTRDEIVDLDADVLTGHRAVQSRLMDGVASYDEVLAYAVAMAGATETQLPTGQQTEENHDALALASRGETMQVRSEDPKEDPKTPEEARAEMPPKPGHPEPDDDEPKDEGDEPDGDEEPKDKKTFCAFCGNKLEQDDPEKEAEGDEPDGDEDPKKEEASVSPAANARAASAVATLFGLRADASVPAVKSAAMSFVALGAKVMKATNTKDPRTALGALQAIIDDAGALAKAQSELKSLRQTVNHSERLKLLNTLSAANLPGYARGELFVDKEVNGQLISEPAPMYAEMKLATLRGLVSGKTQSAARSPSANPFEPSKTAAETAKLDAHANHIVEARPGLVQGAASHSTATVDQLARSAAALEAARMI